MLSCRIMRRTWRRVMPIARSMPISRVRSKTVSTSVLTIPNRLDEHRERQQHVEDVEHRAEARDLVVDELARASAPSSSGKRKRALERRRVRVCFATLHLQEREEVLRLRVLGVPGRRGDRDVAERRAAGRRIEDALHTERHACRRSTNVTGDSEPSCRSWSSAKSSSTKAPSSPRLREHLLGALVPVERDHLLRARGDRGRVLDAAEHDCVRRCARCRSPSRRAPRRRPRRRAIGIGE